MTTNRQRHAPTTCPVCASRLMLTRVTCESCETELSGRFTPCDFCALTDEQRDLLRVFLASRGNLKDLQRHLGVSYPTARARFDDTLRALGIAPAVDAGDERLQVLDALARGEISLDDADEQLSR